MSVANNKNACKNKPWLEALNRAMIRYDGGKVNALNLIADQTVKAAVSGDMWAIKEIGDRVDGKAAQAVTVSGDENNPIAITEIVRTVVKPK
jgi:hypothetical protein